MGRVMVAEPTRPQVAAVSPLILKRRSGAKARAKSAPAKAGKGRAKSKPKDPQVCYYFNQSGGCNKSAEDCKFAHTKLSAAELAKLSKPGTQAKGNSRVPSPASKENKGKPKAEAKAKAKPNSPSYCLTNS